MKQKTIFELKTSKLMAEYLDLKDELLKKVSYSEGLKKVIADEVGYFYEEFCGNWCKMRFGHYTADDADVRIGDIRVKFRGENLNITVGLAVNPASLSQNYKWTEKERQLLAKAKKYWKNCAGYCHLYDYDELKGISGQLRVIKNSVEIVQEYTYSYKEMDLIEHANVCTDRLIIGKSGDEDVLLYMSESKF